MGVDIHTDQDQFELSMDYYDNDPFASMATFTSDNAASSGMVSSCMQPENHQDTKATKGSTGAQHFIILLKTADVIDNFSEMNISLIY